MDHQQVSLEEPRDLTATTAALRECNPELYARWSELLRRAATGRALMPQAEALITVTLDSIVHTPPPLADQHVDEAFEAGCNVAEIVEMVVRAGLLEGGIHSIHDGLEAMERAIVEREARGKPVPRRGAGLTAEDMVPEHPFPVSPIYPYQVPRLYLKAWKKHDPELYEAYYGFLEKRFELRKELRKRTEELVVIAIDSLILWPAPLIDSHLHAAFDEGSNVQEVMEAILAIGQFEGGLRGIQHGLTSLERVIAERDVQGDPAPRTGA